MVHEFHVSKTTTIINFESILVDAYKNHTDLIIFYNLIDRSASRDSNRILIACILEELFKRIESYVIKPILFIQKETISLTTHYKIIQQVCKHIGITVIEHTCCFNTFIENINSDANQILLSKKLNERFSLRSRNLKSLKRLLVKNCLTHLHNKVFHNKILKSALLK